MKILNQNLHQIIHPTNNSPKKQDNVAMGITKQMNSIQEQLAKISENQTMSAEQKLELREELEEQLDTLNRQLVERNFKKQEQQIKQIQSPTRDEDFERSGADLISLASSLKQVSTQRALSTKMKGKAKTLENEIKLDEGRGLDTTEKKAELLQINAKLDSISEQINNALNDIGKEFKKRPANVHEHEKTNQNEEVKKQNLGF